MNRYLQLSSFLIVTFLVSVASPNSANAAYCSVRTRALQDDNLLRTFVVPSVASLLVGTATYWAEAGKDIEPLGAAAVGVGLVTVPFQLLALDRCDVATDEELSKYRRMNRGLVMEEPLDTAQYQRERNRIARGLGYLHILLGSVMVATAEGIWGITGGAVVLGTPIYLIWKYRGKQSPPIPAQISPPETSLFRDPKGGVGLRLSWAF